MKKATTYIVGLLCVAMFLTVTVGCQRRPDLVRTGQVRLHKSSDRLVRVMWAEVRQDGPYAVLTGSTVVKGAMTKKYIGHIEVEYRDVEGNLVARDTSKTLVFYRRGPRTDPLYRRFRIETATNVPVGGTVRVVYRGGPSNKLVEFHQ